MEKAIYILIAVAMFSGCAAISINRAYGRLDYSDGIDEEEAVVIAKKSLLESKYRGEYNFNEFGTTEDDVLWRVSFALKKGIFAKIDDFFTTMAFFPFSVFFQSAAEPCYSVKVSKQTGEVISAVRTGIHPEE